MKKLEDGILSAMIETGRAGIGWKIKIIDTEIMAGSDWATVTAHFIRPRCRKPCMSWSISIYMPRDQIFWDKSTFINF